MKAITVSVEDNVINMARAYAEEHQITLSQLIEDLLRQKIAPSKRSLEKLFELADQNPSVATDYKFCRDDLYDI